MPECRVVPCYKMFLKELKDIMSACPLNISLSSPADISPGVDVEHITIANRHNSHNTFETVNRGVQTSVRLEMKRESPSFHSRILNRQVVIVDSLSAQCGMHVFNNETPIFSTFLITMAMAI